jgi:hypothetical protein
MIQNRIQAPARLKDRRSAIRIEFGYSCIYCGIWESENGGSDNFDLDHYCPESLFPALAREYENLVYSCSACNGFKSDHWPSYTFSPDCILSPFVHEIEEHIDKSQYVWIPLSLTGAFNFERFALDLNFHERRRRRRKVIQEFPGEYEFHLSSFETMATRFGQLNDETSEEDCRKIISELEALYEKLDLRSVSPRMDGRKVRNLM